MKRELPKIVKKPRIYMRPNNKTRIIDEIIDKFLSKLPYPLVTCLIATNIGIYALYYINSESEKEEMRKYMILTCNSHPATLLLSHFSHTNILSLALDCLFIKLLIPMVERFRGPIYIVKALGLGILIGTLLGRISKKTHFTGNAAFLNTIVTIMFMQFGNMPFFLFPKIPMWVFIPISMIIAILTSEYVGLGGCSAGLLIFI